MKMFTSENVSRAGGICDAKFELQSFHSFHLFLIAADTLGTFAVNVQKQESREQRGKVIYLKSQS